MAQEKILIVEDELIIAKDLQIQLREFGYRVPEIVSSGEEALQMMETVCPALVMMDIVLQGELDGIEVADLIRSRFHIPVVYLTAHSDEALMERAKLTEPFGYLLKPFDERELQATIRMALYKGEMDKKLRESHEWLSTTLMSIGDAVIATDARGKIMLMNPVAESLCGWTTQEATGKPIAEIFQIINEKTRKPAEDVVAKVIEEGLTAGLANHTILISREGTEYTIEDSCAPIRDTRGTIIGVVLVFHDITRQKEAEDALRKSRVSRDLILDTARDAFIQIDMNDLVVYWNRQAERTFGWTKTEAIGRRLMETIIPPQYRKAHQEGMKRFMSTGKASVTDKPMELTALHRDGHTFPAEITIWTLGVEGDYLFNAFVKDITRQKQAVEFYRISNTVFNNATEAILVTDANRNIVSVNPAFTKITGYSADEAIGKNPRILKSGRHDQAFYRNMLGTVDKDGHWEGEIWDRRKNGEIYPKWLSITAVKNNSGKIVQYTALFNDITKRKENEQQLHFRAYYDPLTQLPNRTLAFERLSQAILRGNRYKRKVALFFVDLDHFKQVNDTLGHITGDKILVMAAGRLHSAVRETDTVARTGGDEFLIVLTEITDQEEVAIVANKILENLSYPFQVDGHDLFLGASIGITIAPDDGNEVMLLLQNADMAMYQAKSSGRNNYQSFNKKMKKKDTERTLLEWDLRRAVENQELVLHYQPIVDLSSLKTVSLEALIRWNHPERGLIPPERFIPLAENSVLISKISQWVLLTACTQMKLWQEIYGLNTGIAVNVSSRDFRYGNEVFSSITHVLEQSGLAAESLIIEITEGFMLDPNEDAQKKLQTIKDVGIRIAIDDFGTGYSSLSYLARYPIDLLKIDKSFIQGAHFNPQKKPLVEAIVRMGQSMGMKIIAEGVETCEELSYLVKLGCEMAQGYNFSKPLSVLDYEAVLKGRKKDL